MVLIPAGVFAVVYVLARILSFILRWDMKPAVVLAMAIIVLSGVSLELLDSCAGGY
jgi:hypothetical protein